MDKAIIEKRFRAIQESICTQLEAADGKGKFREDAWQREGGGGGFSRIMTNGDVIQKGGVNFSAVYGKTPENILKALKLEPSEFYATGVSIVIHPNNPWVPIIHMNIRYFEMSNGKYWFGGGIDLTPHYIFPEDAKYFHQKLKEVCDRTNTEYYNRFKKWADDYFYIPHRQETRGIGGIFYDRLDETSEGLSKEQLFEHNCNIGELFAPLYVELINRRRNTPYGEKEKYWQHIRRGRYVEFNLVYDNGTKFGLDTNGRTESILMSMPPMAEWTYEHKPEAGSKEESSLAMFKKGIDWINA